MAIKSTRYLDAQGRVILPNHIRKALNLTGGAAVEVDLKEDGTIRIKPAEERCVFCGGPVTDKYITSPTRKRICRSCALAIATAVQE